MTNFDSLLLDILNKENRFMVYVKDRLFTGERQLMMVNALFDPISGISYIFA